MKKIDESGQTLFGIGCALLVVVGICAGIFYWVSQVLHKSHMEEMVKTTATFFQKYQDLLPEFMNQKLSFNDPIYLKSYNMVETCEIMPSTLNPNRKVCEQPLGELDFEVKYDAPYLCSYYYIHFTDMYKRQSCVDFLSAGWEKILPSYMWSDYGYIGVVSESGYRMYFSLNDDYVKKDGAKKHPTKDHLKYVCKICKKSRYCSVLFFLSLDYQTIQDNIGAQQNITVQ